MRRWRREHTPTTAMKLRLWHGPLPRTCYRLTSWFRYAGTRWLGARHSLASLGYDQSADPFRHLPNWNAYHLFQSLRIDDGHRVIPAVGNINRLAVRCEGDPL